MLSDEIKSKYAEIVPALDSVSYYFSDLKTLIKKLEKDIEENTNPKLNIKESIAILDVKLNKTKLSVSKIYENLLKNHGKTYGLRDEEIKQFIKKRKEDIDSLTSIETKEFINLNNYEKAVQLARFEMDVTTQYLKSVEELSLMMGGRPIRCFFTFVPEIIPKQNCLNKGDIFEASISLMHDNSYSFAPSDVQISVDGHPLKFEKGWYTIYKTEPLFKSKTIKISCEIYDEMTGQMMPAFKVFEYKIQLGCEENTNND